MANTDINITESAGLLVPDVSTAAIVAGDSITFNAETDSAVKLCMTAGTAALLGTTDGAEVPAGGSLSLTFTSSSAGAHGIALQFAGKSCPGKIGTGAAGTVSIEPARKGAAPIPPDPDEPPPSGTPGTDG